MRLLLAGFLALLLAAPASAADITVTTRADTVAADGRCSLREAVTAANTNIATGGCTAGALERDVILLGEGHHLLSRAGARENGNATGDLDVVDGGLLTLQGVGRERTIVSAEGLDRVVDLLAGDVTIAGVSIVGGAAPDGADGAAGTNPGAAGEPGGGVRSSDRLELRDSAVRGNRAGRGGGGGGGSASVPAGPGGRGGDGGGIWSTGTLTLIRTRVADNRAGASGPAGSAFVGASALEPGGDGGGIAGFGITTVSDSVVEANRAGAGGDGGGGALGGGDGAPGGDGGGIVVTGPADISDSRIAGNAAGAGGRGGSATANGGNGGRGGHGGGVWAMGSVSVLGTLFAGNATGEGGGGGDVAPGPAGNAGDGRPGGDGAGLIGFIGASVNVSSSTFFAGTTGAGGPPGAGQFGNGGPAGSGTALSAVGTVTVARTIVEGTCGSPVADGSGNLGTHFSCPVTLANLALDANGMPGSGSHAIDAASSCPAFDLAGTARPQGAGCDVGALEVPAASVAVARTGLEFGSVTVGGAATRSVDVSNPGLPSLPLSVAVSGDPAFTNAGDTCTPLLLPGAACTVAVRFAPTATGARTGSLQIGGETLALAGTGVAAPSDPPGGSPQATAAPCVVPRLKGTTLIVAARSLQNANCKLGTVTRRGRGRQGRVRSFSPKAGTSLPAGATVRLVLNRRPRR